MNSNRINLKDLKVGDNVTITFCPYSQKYLDYLTPKTGVIVEVGKYYFDYRIKTDSGTEYESEENLFHEGVSYYGDTLGYDYTIYRN